MIALPEGSVTKWEDDEDVGSLREANRKSANAKHGGAFREGLQEALGGSSEQGLLSVWTGMPEGLGVEGGSRTRSSFRGLKLAA